MSKQPNEIECTQCGTEFRVLPEQVGDQVPCPDCGAVEDRGAVKKSDHADSSDDLAERADQLFGELDFDALKFGAKSSALDGSNETVDAAVAEEPKPARKHKKPAKKVGKKPKAEVRRKEKPKREKPAASEQPPVASKPKKEREPTREPKRPIASAPPASKSADLGNVEKELTKVRNKSAVDEDEADPIFGVKCKICDTRVHVRESKIGSNVECPMCFTQIPVKEPLGGRKAKKTAANKTASKNAAKKETTVASNSDDGTFKLSDEFDRPPVDYSLEEGYGLSPVENDLLSAPIDLTDAELDEDDLIEAEVAVEQQIQPKDAVQEKPASRSKKAKESRRQRLERRENETPRKKPTVPTKPVKPDEPEGTPVRSDVDVDGEGEYVTWALIRSWLTPMPKNMELVLRTALGTMFLSLAYLMFGILSGIVADGSLEWGDKFVRGVLPGIGGALCLGVATLTLAIVFAVLFRVAASDNRAMDQWIGFEFSEWIGSFAFVAFAGWLASIPGLIVGNIGWALTDSISTMYLCTVVSVFLLAPPLYIAALFNNSVMNIFSIEVYKTIASDWVSWFQTYKFVGLALLIFFVGYGILCIPFFLVAFIGGALHVLALIVFAIVVGLQAQRVIVGIQNDDDY